MSDKQFYGIQYTNEISMCVKKYSMSVDYVTTGIYLLEKRSIHMGRWSWWQYKLIEK